MKISEETSPDGTVVALEGELTLPEAARLQAVLVAALEADRPVRLDLARVDEIDLACLQLLLSAARSFSAAGLAFEAADSPGGLWANLIAAAGVPASDGRPA